MSALRGAVHAKWIIGKVIGTKIHQTAKVRVTRLILDPYLTKVKISPELEVLFSLMFGYNLAEVRISRLAPEVVGAPSLEVLKKRLDNHLSEMFYKKRKTYFAHDPQQQCIEGDIVLLKALPERKSKNVKHELAEIVYKVGKVIDPLTGKPCAGQKFRESVTDTENLTDRDTSFLSEKLQELTVSSPDK